MSDIPNSSNKGYGIVYKDIMKNPNISAEAKTIYAYLSSYAGNKDTAFPSVSLICYELNMSKNRFYKHRKELVEKGIISTARERTDNGFSKNIYTLNHKTVCLNFEDIRNEDIQNVDIQNEDTKKNSVKKNNIKKNSVNKNSATNVASEHEEQLLKEFNDWWSLYNKKKDKKVALSKFKIARKQHSLETIVKGTKSYLKTVTNKQYQKHPKTFLNNETFLDEFDEHEITQTNKTDSHSSFDVTDYLADME